jgi:hypothetical protein
MTSRRFPTPWHADKVPAGYVVRDANRQALAYLYARETKTKRGRRRCSKLEPKLGIDMSFTELIERLMRTDPKEVERSVEKAKQEKPPDTKRRPRRRE